MSSTKREEVLPAGLQQKIDRYVKLWKREYGGAWPAFPEKEQPLARYPRAAERLLDDVLFRGLRILDGFTAFVYCYAPFGWLEKYRSFKNRRYQNSSPEKEQPSHSSNKAEILPRVEVSELK